MPPLDSAGPRRAAETPGSRRAGWIVCMNPMLRAASGCSQARVASRAERRRARVCGLGAGAGLVEARKIGAARKNSVDEIFGPSCWGVGLPRRGRTTARRICSEGLELAAACEIRTASRFMAPRGSLYVENARDTKISPAPASVGVLVNTYSRSHLSDGALLCNLRARVALETKTTAEAGGHRPSR